MTTELKNVEFSTEINSFRNPQSPVSPLLILFAMADLVRSKTTSWFKTNECKALLLSLIMEAYGPDCKIDTKKERARLDQVIS